MNKVFNTLKKMFLENTGSHFLDSGGHYCYNYDRNKKIEFKEELKRDIIRFDDDSFSKNTFIYFNNHFEFDEFSNMLNKNKALLKKNYLEIEEYLIKTFNVKGLYGEDKLISGNSYNYENILDQVFIYIGFSINKIDYIGISLHNGCDVRGGYTDFKFFKLSEGLDYFLLGFNDCSLTTKENKHYWSDDGYNFYNDDDNTNKTYSYEELYKKGIEVFC